MDLLYCKYLGQNSLHEMDIIIWARYQYGYLQRQYYK
jgi:hypothetical protein